LSLLKGVLRFVLLTLAICLLGGMIGSVGALAGKPPGLTAWSILGMVIVFLSPFLSAAWLWRRRRKAKAQEAAMRLMAEEQHYQENLPRRRLIERQRLIDAVDQHRGALERNLARAVRTNDYGTVVQDMTGKALAEFFASIALDGALFSFEDAKALVFEQLNTRRREQVAAGFDAGSVPLDGHEFEHWVADALKRYGWKAEVTRGSGDQGLDVIAEKKGKRVGLQCKLYGGPVGNKAVQEAHAGKVYYGVDAVGVLTNASFTPSATALAAVTGVKLFSQHDIPSLFEKTFAAR
jgi:restriction system protein